MELIQKQLINVGGCAIDAANDPEIIEEFSMFAKELKLNDEGLEYFLNTPELKEHKLEGFWIMGRVYFFEEAAKIAAKFSSLVGFPDENTFYALFKELKRKFESFTGDRKNIFLVDYARAIYPSAVALLGLKFLLRQEDSQKAVILERKGLYRLLILCHSDFLKAEALGRLLERTRKDTIDGNDEGFPEVLSKQMHSLKFLEGEDIWDRKNAISRPFKILGLPGSGDPIHYIVRAF